MPTKNKRMSLTLPPDIHQAYMELSRASGFSATSFALRILTEAIPQVNIMTKMYREMNKPKGNLITAMEKHLPKNEQGEFDINFQVVKLRKTPKK